ncbi:MAG TPA: type II toxin-antitoxin system RelE/ParE family toxin [Gordonia sp. (in: high G+C Gram-positive bacteria)]|uniref:type II toxin-antitoxin system RelE/ParE family toxin n=1 Tax=unclassified Gordonia (in: high G+C Gram-positive bacteria) TaxID=2657482 RepID=UPI000FB98AE9|nr:MULTISPECIES: type II toxin-antitoxin system RelE/ParE family toxin [unclassified Gordonia (in: high G+C Gram-positive bacteria)]RUP40641.1 MAG: type II toxin-antitoxin system RelE/ParE family toxin [Gordonia sp. (in: high G+C Gram-positive bacteria)]HNP59054.1 type II toxin-antitoxin system RelE/ParE family toxin [Gordonia sp. (in: high G+C Gram-positive bacteria)]HRC52732.1 type II toxin-antitoxin system RelE/ParE family toxin [Gordonia sp. (in: high G+C Gram-positive bacteria)]
MTAYRLTPAAQSDLSEIWDYIAEHWDLQQAEIYINEIRAAFERIADDPDRGRACDGIREGYRRYSIGSHVLFYIARPDGVDVIRLLHQRMDPARHL